MGAQLNVKTVLFQAIQFCISTHFSSIWPIERTLLDATTLGQNEPIERTLLDATTLGQNEPGIDGTEGVLCILQSSSIAGTSPSDCLVSYTGHSLGRGLTLLERFSRCILQPKPTLATVEEEIKKKTFAGWTFF